MNMKCKKVQKLLSRLFDNELKEELRVAIENHLARCEMCRKDFEELKDLKAVLNSIPSPVVPYYLTTRIVAQLRKTDRPHQVVSPLVWRVAAGILITIGLGLGVIIGRGLAVNGSISDEIATLNAEPSIDEFFTGWR
ncbi:MAG: anti-sigma factor family protein [bacterium]